MSLSIKISKIINRIVSLIKNFKNYWEKYLLTIVIEIANIEIEKGDYYFTTR